MVTIKVLTAIVSWLLLVAAMVSSCGGSGSPGVIRTVVSETLLTRVVDELPLYPSVSYSPDCRRVAYIADRGGEKYVVVDGVPSEKGYDAITTNVISTLV